MALFKILRGNSSKLIKSNGAINSETKWTDGYAYYCTDTHDFYIDHLDSNGTQVRSKLNAKEAEKLRASRDISLGEAVTSTATGFDGTADITIPINSVKESYLTWGGKNFADSHGPIDAAMIPQLGANRFAFIKEEAIKVEYSKDNGSTWIESTSTYKHRLFGIGESDWTIGGDSTVNLDKTQWQIRITITASKAPVYTELNKFAIYSSTNGSTGCWCTVRGRLKSKVEAGENTWKTFASQVAISGWPSWNIINVDKFTSYGGNASNKSYQYEEIQFIFGVTQHLSSNNYKGLSINRIMGFGGVGWGAPSTLAKTGNLYSYDSLQNVTFPAKVTAATLESTGNTTITGALTVKGDTILGDSHSDTILLKGISTIGDRTRTYATAQSHSLYGNLELYKGYFYIESEDGSKYFVVNGDPNDSYTEINSMPLNLVGRNATLSVNGTSQFNHKITIGNSNNSTNTNTLLDVYGEIVSNALSVCGGATIDDDLNVGGTIYTSHIVGGTLADSIDLGVMSSNSVNLNPYALSLTNSASALYASISYGGVSVNDFEGRGAQMTRDAIEIFDPITNKGVGMTSWDGCVVASDYMEAPQFIGNLTGTADEAYSLTWAYFDDTGTIS